MYIHWESCTHACTNASITLQAKYEFKRNPVTYAYIDWWLKLFNTRSYLRNVWMLLKRRVMKLTRMKMNLFCCSVNKFGTNDRLKVFRPH
ncbi:hypothetical protein ACFXTN_025598 [Malus domestica]